MKKNNPVTLSSASIEKQTAAFLKSGGSVQFIPNGVSGIYSQGGSYYKPNSTTTVKK